MSRGVPSSKSPTSETCDLPLGPRERRSGGLLLSLGALLLGVSGLAFASRHLPQPERPAFDAAPLRALRKHPDYVLLGNSMVYTRLNEHLLNSLIAPRHALSLAASGSRTALWYVQMKNYVIAAHYRPRRVIVFFRDDELTRPRDATTGADLAKIQRASPAPDPVVEAKLVPSFRTPMSRLQWMLWRTFPVEPVHDLFADRIESFATRVSEAWAPDVNGEPRRRVVNTMFGLNAARDGFEVPDPSDIDQRPFERVAGESFLPEMLTLAREARIPLLFLRVRTRNRARGIPEPRALTRYVEELRRYIEQGGAELVDMRDADWERLDLYGLGDHIAMRRTTTYTRLFVEHMPNIFR